jgi:citrate lyase subunit beta/citryl-CoA lyase
VRIHPRRRYAEIKASVTTGLTGIVLPDADRGADVVEIDAMLAEREREEGIPVGDMEIFVQVSTPTGVWNIGEIFRATPRVNAAALDEAALCRAMRIVPDEHFDALTFCRGRLIVETMAATAIPIGFGHPLSALPLELNEQQLLEFAESARNIGFKGAMCPFAAWVQPCNQAFTPTAAQVAYYRDVRKAFAEAVARGTAADPFPGGRMIDVPVDELAKVVIDLWERCQQRDADKAAAQAAR